jgi:hypothetical protein
MKTADGQLADLQPDEHQVDFEHDGITHTA